MPSIKKITTLRLDDDIAEELKKIAENENRSLNNLIETILINYLKHKKEHKTPPFNNERNIQIGNNNNYKGGK